MTELPSPDQTEVDNFWEVARAHAGLNVAPGYFGPTTLESVPPPAWSFGGSPAQADELLALVLAGTKTATASSRADYADESELPQPGGLAIVLDGAGHPGALIAITAVDVVPFREVDAEHAYAEGEGDRSLDGWRDAHRSFFTDHASEGFDEDMLVVLERFQVLYRR